MTEGRIILIISHAHHQSRTTRDSRDALRIVEALVENGLCVDDQYGEASLEARIERVVDELEASNDGDFSSDDVGESVAVMLGLVSEAVA